jgi:hypothetical protein
MVAGEPWTGSNPRLTVPPGWHEVVRLWAACRSPEGGIAHWPDAGGVGDQAAWLVDAFSTLGTIYAAMTEAEQRRLAERRGS